jgi:hypothetical protein
MIFFSIFKEKAGWSEPAFLEIFAGQPPSFSSSQPGPQPWPQKYFPEASCGPENI